MSVSVLKSRFHRVTTPEGISLPFEVALAGDRLSAFLLDVLFIVLASFAAGMVAAAIMAAGMRGIGYSVSILLGFVLWNFYFVLFEVGWGGRTPGKRMTQVRVIARDGGPLTVEAVFARNLMRNLELYLPFVAILAPEALVPNAPGWGRFLAILWILVFALMPFFNEDRLRCGDLVAGTLVVKAPKAVLLSDLAAPAPERRAAPPVPLPVPAGAPAPPPLPPTAEPVVFTREQLDIYGIHELQVLEDLLRRYDQNLLDPRVLDEVAEKIKTKIAWPRDRWQVPTRPFLTAFYRAQRNALEQRLLFGQRRERKRG